MKLNPSLHEVRESAVAAMLATLSLDPEAELKALELEGWYSVAVLAEQAKKTRDCIEKKLRKNVHSGIMEMQKFPIGGRKTLFFRLL